MNCIFCKTDIIGDNHVYSGKSKLLVKACPNKACSATHFINKDKLFLEQSDRDYGNIRINIYFDFQYEEYKHMKNVMYIHDLTTHYIYEIKFINKSEIESRISIYNLLS